MVVVLCQMFETIHRDFFFKFTDMKFDPVLLGRAVAETMVDQTSNGDPQIR